MSLPSGNGVSSSSGPPPPPPRGYDVFVSAFNACVVPPSNTASVPNATISSRATTTSTSGHPLIPPRYHIPTRAFFAPFVPPPSNTASVPNAPVSSGTPTMSNQSKPTSSVNRAVSIPQKALSTGLYRDLVTLMIGAAKVKYTLHKGILCFYSDFFRVAFNGSFKEANERTIELPEVEVDVFEASQVWLYTQSLPKNETASIKVYPEWPLLVKLWIFGDGCQISLLQNNVIDAIIDKVAKDNTVPTNSLNLTYENTVSNSPLRKAITDIMTYRSKLPDGTPGYAESNCLLHSDEWPKDACLDVMAEMSRAWRQRYVRGHFPQREKCYYHVHAKGEHC